ncbi:aminoglycoside phosphotransferase family protein [Rhodococcus sp. IEGM 1343]|uniref:aminoglycoside phosphotransferase family protein n=1 Tax=Rhodococcus sp. IEGM 1343 TaxID=3082224 RepID=UPI002952CEF4|nr:aminoglycoside phosphotransferase family protein [Rhodococcus sp. IEGM 1343]MDV8058407.1 aminoglycoside phosphotransferase family protein [Rhodococcus sp. IEGM 1343]
MIEVEPLSGGITADTRKLTVWNTHGFSRHLVLRSYATPASLRYAEDWLSRESNALTMLSGSGVPTPELVGVDPGAEHCEYPSLLMTHLPGSVVLTDEGVDERVRLLARQLVQIHAVNAGTSPREFQASTTADTVVVPARADTKIWAAAQDLLRGPVPTYEGRFLHRDFQPGNVLFDVSQNSAPRDHRSNRLGGYLAGSNGPRRGALFDQSRSAAWPPMGFAGVSPVGWWTFGEAA